MHRYDWTWLSTGIRVALSIQQIWVKLNLIRLNFWLLFSLIRTNRQLLLVFIKQSLLSYEPYFDIIIFSIFILGWNAKMRIFIILLFWSFGRVYHKSGWLSFMIHIICTFYSLVTSACLSFFIICMYFLHHLLVLFMS